MEVIEIRLCDSGNPVEMDGSASTLSYGAVPATACWCFLQADWQRQIDIVFIDPIAQDFIQP